MDTSNSERVKTTEEYWDCECELPKGYIWPKSVEECPRCGARHDEQPDSRVNEVAKAKANGAGGSDGESLPT